MALDNQHKCLGFRIIVRDHKGLVTAAQSKRVNVFQELVISEAMGALMAAKFSRDLGLLDIILEGNSLQVVQPLRDAGPS